MSILAVGSVAFDNIATPSGTAENVLGGSATYFALAASYFTDVRVVAVVGDDFTAEHENVLKKRGVDTRGIEHAKGQDLPLGRTVSRQPQRSQNRLHRAECLREFQPRIPAEYHDSDVLFLANIHPSLQAAVRREMNGVQLTGGDTMNFWIQGHAELRKPSAGQRAPDQRRRSQNAREETSLPARRAQGSRYGPAGTGHQARRIWRDHFLSRRRLWHRPASFSRARLADRRSQRSHWRWRFFRWRIHGIHRLAGRNQPRGHQARLVLWRRHGIVCRGTLWH